jgi:hypothetical protein
MRELVTTTSLFVLLLIALETPGLPGARTDVAGAAASEPRPIAAAPILSGAGFAVCSADTAWHRPTDAEQRAHLRMDGRFADLWATPTSDGFASLNAPAILYDGKSVDGLSGVAELAGLWNIWTDKATRPKTCWTEQPQVFLLGYEAVAYDAQDLGTASLRVRPAPGYRIVVLTGPIRPEIAVIADHRLDTLDVPAAWVTPQLPAGRVR